MPLAVPETKGIGRQTDGLQSDSIRVPVVEERNPKNDAYILIQV